MPRRGGHDTYRCILRTLKGGLARELPRSTKCILLPKVASACSQRQRGSGAWGCVKVARFLSFDDMTRRPARARTCAPGSADTAYLCGLAAYLRNPAADPAWLAVMRPGIRHATSAITPSLPRALGPPQRAGLRKIVSSRPLLSRVRKLVTTGVDQKMGVVMSTLRQ